MSSSATEPSALYVEVFALFESYCTTYSTTDWLRCVQGQAKNYNDAGTLTDDPNLIGTQIGKGVYTSPGPGGFPGGATPWFVTAPMFTCFRFFLHDSQVLRYPRRLRCP